jgi:hypothetical protein
VSKLQQKLLPIKLEQSHERLTSLAELVVGSSKALMGTSRRVVRTTGFRARLQGERVCATASVLRLTLLIC